MGKYYQITNDHGDVIDAELDDDITEAETGADPENRPDNTNPTIQQALADAETDDSHEIGQELDCDD